MENVRYILERPLWMLMLIPVAVLLLLIFFTMKKEKRRKGKTIASLALHGIIALILAVLASGFCISSETDRQSTVILVDVSESTLSVREDMTAICKSLLDEFAERDVKGVVLFGQDTVFVGTKSQWGKVSLEKADASGSDITSAMYRAVELMDKYTHKRIILLSDGKETSGDALYAARRLAEEGVRIDTMYFDTNGQAEQEAQINTMSSVGGGYIGEELKIALTLESNIQGEATVALYDGDTPIEERSVTLTLGETVVTYDLTAETAGLHTYRAVLTCDGDTETRNNEAYTALRTYGKTSLLIIAKNPSEAEDLKNILAADAEVTVVSQEEAPSDLPTLSHYDGYYLMNVDAQELPADLESSLDKAVKFLGKSLCFVGGDKTFSEGNMVDTTYEKMLPLGYGASSNKRAIFLVIDVSGSMENNNALELAKIGAIKTLDSLKATDYVSVIAFAGRAQTMVYPTKVTAENKKKIAKTISSITVGGGTMYTPALHEVELLLEKMDEEPDIKHVVFLSDGSPGENANDIFKVVENMHEKQGILLSTIEISIWGNPSAIRPNKRPTGGGSSSSYGMEVMAQKGGGTYNLVTNALDLPNVMVEQTETYSPQYAFETPFTPLVAVSDEITEGLTTLPQIKGYVGMHAKEDATVHLTSDTGDPIYASWEYGKGIVACFTTDLASRWSQAFLLGEAGQSFIKNAQKATCPTTRYDAAFIPSVTVDGSHVTVKAELPEGGNDFELMAEISGPEQRKIQLDRISSSTYEGSLALGTSGEYEVTVTWRKRARVVDTASAVFAVSYSGEYDLFREEDHSLLSGIADATGGFLNAAPGYLAIIDPGILRSVITFEIPLCIIAALLMLVDIIIRRLTWADVKRFFINRGKDV